MTYKASKTVLNLLILYQKQFGHHIDTYFYCKYLRDRHNITYLCWDYLMPKDAMEGINVIYISRAGNLLVRNLRYIRAVISYLRRNSVDVCFIVYFRGCSLLKLLLPKKNFVFDIRTGYIKQNVLSGMIYNFFLRLESIFFRHITVISKSLAEKLKLENKSKILSLGSIPISDRKGDFNDVKLLYVGTLLNRRIDKTIRGLYAFLQKNAAAENVIQYTIIGDSDHDELEQLKGLVQKLNLEKHVHLLGRIPFDQLKPHFDTHNIGVSFVPIIPCFDVQPPTKTFDYLLSGMPVIATSTSENKLVINKGNGVLIDDTIEGFASGIESIYKGHPQFKYQEIRSAAQRYHWRFIVDDLEQYLLSVCNSK
ncbi:glycosyltransferase [Desulfobacula toluolica]|uniref:Predicted glycosyltransferase, family I n=1 Tax=Desulfobacula toluolica (strain DSM 7467 / Tol2) TaxID=651182 RepID=K0NS56_DESTT|nr:glycosyltransferase [Desulfobacula toluolica]CCK81817.1 predicted glycosyltransferase, family I [Desulfobacula toluolica Tol2]